MMDYIDDTSDGVFKYFLVNKLRCSDTNIIQFDGDLSSEWPISTMTMWTITTTERINYVNKFREFIYSLFKKLNLNAVFGTIERHPNKKGLHAHVIIANTGLTEIRCKGVWFHRTIGRNTESLFHWIDYMFKDLKPKNYFSPVNVYGNQAKAIKENSQNQEDNQNPTHNGT